MARNKGQFTSSKMADGAYNSGTDQESAQDDGHPEISCVLPSPINCFCNLFSPLMCEKNLAFVLNVSFSYVGVLIAALVPNVHQ